MTPPNRKSSDIAGQSILVVGGTRGIGRAISLRLAHAGAKVCANYVRDQEAAAGLAAQATAEKLPIEILRADVSIPTGIATLAERVKTNFSPLNGLVYAAATGTHKDLAELTNRHFDFTFQLNVRAFLEVVRVLAPSLAPGASIITLSSEGAAHAIPSYGLVGASKAALESVTRQLAIELGPRGIRANVVSPGAIVTDVWKAMPDADARLQVAASRTANGRLVTPEEVAEVVGFLCSPVSSGISGTTLIVDGGARVRG